MDNVYEAKFHFRKTMKVWKLHNCLGMALVQRRVYEIIIKRNTINWAQVWPLNPQLAVLMFTTNSAATSHESSHIS